MADIAGDSPVRSGVVPKKRRGRRPKVPLMKEVETAYAHLHDLDWLQDCALASLPDVRERVQPRQFMPEVQALRGLLILAARQVIDDIEDVPSLAGARVFLEMYLEGKKVSEITKELGVSRERCSRHYRKKAFRLATLHFIRINFGGR